MKLYQMIYAGVILTAFGLGLSSPELKPLCVGFLFGASIGWLIHLIGTSSLQLNSPRSGKNNDLGKP